MPSPVPFRKLRKQLEDANWQEVRVKGSHHTFKHRLVAEIVTITVHNNKAKHVYARKVEKAVAQAKAAEQAEDQG